MPFLARVQQFFQTRLYRFIPTERLIARVAQNNRPPPAVLNALRERRAFQDGALEAVDWSSSQLNQALLSSCRLARASFAQAHLQGAYLAYSDLRQANFEGANLADAHLREANLAGANLTAGKLRGANFARADLRRAVLAAADLSQANLWRADLRGADLTDAAMIDCQISDVKIDAATILPNGKAGGAAVDWQEFTVGKGSNPD